MSNSRSPTFSQFGFMSWECKTSLWEKRLNYFPHFPFWAEVREDLIRKCIYGERISNTLIMNIKMGKVGNWENP